MEKYIIYGKGAIFKRFESKILWNQVVAIADKNVRKGEKIHNIPVISPDNIHQFDYDYISIFSSKFFDEIKIELVRKYFVSELNIVSWKVLLNGCQDEFCGNFFLWQNFISEKKIRKILDIGGSILPKFYFSKEQFTENEEVDIDLVGNVSYPIYKRLYGNIYHTIKYCEAVYDLILVWSWSHEIESMLSELCGRTRYILLYVNYKTVLMKNKICEIESIIKRYGQIHRYMDINGIIWSIDTRPDNKRKYKDVKLYVVTHKEYNILNNQMYVPICVGGNYSKKEFLNELCGENISYLNNKINECTALFWIWKNTSDEYIGLNHYRRYFYNDNLENMDNYLNQENASLLLDSYDLLMAKSEILPYSVLCQIKNSIPDSGIFEKGLDIIRYVMHKNQPDFVDAFERVIAGNKFYQCNMFVTRREIFDKYCEWLFSFLIEAAETIDISECDTYSARIIGFFAERMWTVWLLRQEYRIKELPFSRN